MLQCNLKVLHAQSHYNFFFILFIYFFIMPDESSDNFPSLK